MSNIIPAIAAAARFFQREADFAIEIPDRAITPANFTSVVSIGHVVRTLRPTSP